MSEARPAWGAGSVQPMSDPLAWLTSLEGVGSAYAASRDAVDLLLRDRGLRRTTADDSAEALLRGAVASAHLEDSSATAEEIRDGVGDATAQAALRVSTELLPLAQQLQSAPLQAIARLHTLAARGAVADDRLGRPRDQATADRLITLARTLGADTTAPAMVVAALVHAELRTVAPFDSHNGLVARAAERLVLISRGVDERALTVPEAGHLDLRAEYESNLRGYQQGGETGLHSWLLYAAEAYARGVEHSPLTRR